MSARSYCVDLTRAVIGVLGWTKSWTDTTSSFPNVSPEGWGGYQVTRRFRGMNLTINVVNVDGLATGVSSVAIDDIEVAPFDDEERGALVPVEALADGDVLTVTMG